MMTDITIDFASNLDREWCAKLMASSEPWLTLGPDFATCLARCRSPEFVVLMARRADSRCGFVLLHPTGLAGSPYIASIATSAAVRGQGIGSALLGAAERWLPQARPHVPVRLVVQHAGAAVVRGQWLHESRRVPGLRYRRRLRDPDAQTPGAAVMRPWRLVALLSATATASYLCRVNVSVAGVLGQQHRRSDLSRPDTSTGGLAGRACER